MPTGRSRVPRSAAATPARDAVGEPPPEWPTDAVEVGRVVGAWGVKGGIKVKPFSADPQALFSSKRWYLRLPDAAAPSQASGTATRLLRVQQAREQGDHVVATAHDLGDRDGAERLAGAQVYVPRSSFPTPDRDEFYWVDLIGLPVVDRGQALLGTVVGLIETGPTCVLRVRGGDAEAEEVLIPFVAAYVDEVDLAGRRIRVDWNRDF